MKDIKAKLFALLEGAESLAITTHIASDADGMVAAFALQKILLGKGIESTIITDGEELDRYDFLGYQGRLLPYEPDMAFEALIVLDCNGYGRLGERAQLAYKAKKVAVFDHHIIEDDLIRNDLQCIEYRCVSVGAMVWELFEEDILSLPEEDMLFVANCMYVTILNDSNNFSNSNTHKEVFELAAKLTGYGIKPYELQRSLMQDRSPEELIYLGRSLSTIKLHLDGKILFFHSTYALAKELNFDPTNKMSVIRSVQGIQSVLGIAHFTEVEEGEWRISLRSQQLDVQEIAYEFGGGGHRRASGLSLSGSLPEVEEKLLKSFAKAIDKL